MTRTPPSVLVRPDDEPTAAALLCAGVAVMAVHGFHGASVRDVAAASGTSPAVLYHHFESKHGLLATMLDRGMDLLLVETEQALYDAPEDPAARLDAIVGAHVRVHLTAQRESLLGNSELRSLEPGARALVVSKRDAQQRMFDRVVRDGALRGLFATPYPDDAARVVTTACTAVAAWFRRSGELAPDEIVVRYTRIARDTVGCRGG